jgi:hypothetical protein
MENKKLWEKYFDFEARMRLGLAMRRAAEGRTEVREAHEGMSEQRTRSVAARRSPKGEGGQPPKPKNK